MTKEMRDLDKIREDYEVHLGSREFKGIVVTGIVIGLLVFAFGFLVGRLFPRQTLPERLTEEVSQPESQPAASDMEEPPAESPGYSFYEELSGAEEEAPSADVAQVPTKPAELPPPQGKVDEEEDLQSALDELTAESAPETSAPTAHPTQILPSLYTVQVGAFEEAAVAEKLSHHLQQKGYPAYTMVKMIPDKGVWHRVRVGQYSNRAEAEGVVVQMGQREHLSGFITLYAKSKEMQ